MHCYLKVESGVEIVDYDVPILHRFATVLDSTQRRGESFCLSGRAGVRGRVGTVDKFVHHFNCLVGIRTKLLDVLVHHLAGLSGNIDRA